MKGIEQRMCNADIL